MRRTGIVAVLAMVLSAVGCQPGAPFVAPCADVVERADAARTVLFRTGGAGVEGRGAVATIVQTVGARPDCFTDDQVRAAHDLRVLLPYSDAEADALRRAEEDCGRDFASMVSGAGDGFETPTGALENSDADLPGGDGELSFQEDGQAGFAFRDDGVYRGWVLVSRGDDGWFVRRVITCAGVPTTEETTQS